MFKEHDSCHNLILFALQCPIMASNALSDGDLCKVIQSNDTHEGVMHPHSAFIRFKSLPHIQQRDSSSNPTISSD